MEKNDKKTDYTEYAIAWMQAHGQPQDWAGPQTGAPQPSND